MVALVLALFTGLASIAVIRLIGSEQPSGEPDRLYSSSSPFNQRIPRDPELSPDSAAQVQTLSDEADENGWPISSGVWTNTVFYAGRSTPRWHVATRAPGEPEFDGVPIPRRAFASRDADAGLIVIDRESGCEYDFGRFRWENGKPTAYFMNALRIRGGFADENGDGVYDKGAAPSASGFASAAGMIRPEEMQRGYINHALTFTMQHARGPVGWPVRPATNGDGRYEGRGTIPMGARIQLDPAFNVDAAPLQPWQKVIARALQEYGAYLKDTGGTFAFHAQHQATSGGYVYPWGRVDYAYLPTWLVRHLRVLAYGTQYEGFWEYVPTGCARRR